MTPLQPLCNGDPLSLYVLVAKQCFSDQLLCRRDRSAPSDSKMATRDRTRSRDRSKSAEVSCDPPLPPSSAPARQSSLGPHRLASGQLPSAPAATTAAAPAPSPPLRPSSAADLLMAAAAAVNRADALQRSEASGSDASPHSWQAPSGPRRKRDDRRARKDRFGEMSGRADELQGDEGATASGEEARRVKRKVGISPA